MTENLYISAGVLVSFALIALWITIIEKREHADR